ncbi:glycosyltransferase family 4 protein, partial [bacterium]|nr:glycosyltransferase family 4 protein [bacterium]
MKVVVLSQALHPAYGGSAVSEASLCAKLQERHTAVVLCPAGAYDAEFGRRFGLTTVKEFQPTDVLRAWLQPTHWLNRVLDGAGVVHVNGHWRWDFILLARMAHGRGIPYLLHPRGMLWVGHRKVFLKKVFNWLLGNWVVSHASRVIALSQFERQQWAPYGLSEEKCPIIPNGIQKVATPSEQRPYALPYYLYLGRLESRKNLVFLVQAFSRYVQAGGNADLLFVGPAERGYDSEVADEIERLGLKTRARILPPAFGPERDAFLRHALAVVYPSVGEPFGRVPFETLAAGGLPIVPLESGSAEYLQRFLPGSVYPVRDGAALA